ncbi:BRCA1-associated protein-like [Corticium candelabrum]|uniref:BRCA1-associated protein-like n=1 Tax=Corticium candelabrum TaxID=121492 RepID=UPI002E27008E|nr:BRCA1-associated protein-like [Corticium candelabrum]
MSKIAIRLEVAADAALPRSLPQRQVNEKQASREISRAEALPDDTHSPIGQRQMKRMSVETYTPNVVASSAAEGLDEANRLSFFSGNPAVEITRGFLHVYMNDNSQTIEADCSLLCILAIPATLTCRDLLKFIASASPTIDSIRVIRDSTPNQYMALINFKDKTLASSFYSEVNGRSYNSFEDYKCSMALVSHVEAVRTSDGASQSVAGLTELPSCPVCLERLDDSVNTVLTILCNHSFHSSCLEKWSDTTCPVCRYCQSPEPAADNKCFLCDVREDLWICLICGHVGCGRYVEAHAFRHYEATQHAFAMQLGSQRVWNYLGDNYVHRLIQNKSDGKLVEVEGNVGQELADEKIDSLTLEYTHMLTSQLDSQRLYFEEKMARMEKEALDQVTALEDRSRKYKEEMERLECQLHDDGKSKRKLEKRIEQLTTRLSKAEEEVKEEKEMNKCLRDNQQALKEKIERDHFEWEKRHEDEVHELSEQIRDLMFYVETQQKMERVSDEQKQELQDGQIVVESPSEGGTATASTSSGHSKGRKSKKRK